MALIRIYDLSKPHWCLANCELCAGFRYHLFSKSNKKPFMPNRWRQTLFCLNMQQHASCTIEMCFPYVVLCFFRSDCWINRALCICLHMTAYQRYSHRDSYLIKVLNRRRRSMTLNKARSETREVLC